MIAISSFFGLRRAISLPSSTARKSATGSVIGMGNSGPIGKPHLFEHAVVVGLAHKTVQRRKGAGGQKLNITHRSRGKLNRRECVGVLDQSSALLPFHHQIDQLAPIRGDQINLSFWLKLPLLFSSLM